MKQAARRRGARPATAALLAALCGGIPALAPRTAAAKSASALPYPTPEVWAAAVRYLRVDRGFGLREKDEKAGYVLFDLTEAGKTFHASLELVALTEDDGRASTEVVINIPEMPRRYEMLLLGELGAKIRQERGPAPAPKPRAVPAEPDKNKEKDRDKDAAKSHGEPDGGLPRAPTIPVP